MTILIIGGTGNTGRPLAGLLHAAGYPILLTSRSGKVPEPFKGVSFDWDNESTFENPFRVANDIERVYLIGPAILDPLPIVKPFIELAITKGVKRFVLLSASLAPPGGPFAGSVHQYFIDNARDYEYVALRPSSFMQNFIWMYGKVIKEKNYIFSSAEEGRVAFIHTDDIAQAAFEALTTDSITHGERYVVGPQLFSFDEVAALLSRILGREITHKRLSPEEHIGIFTSFGLPREYAQPLVNAEVSLKDGTEVDIFNAPPEKKFVGKITLEEFFTQNASVWK